MSGSDPGGVLIIDDSLTVRAIIDEMLTENRGLRVIGSASGVDTARMLIERHRPNVITLDLAVPSIGNVGIPGLPKSRASTLSNLGRLACPIALVSDRRS